MLQSLEGVEPEIDDSAYVHPAATIIGDVTLKADTSVWPGVVLRGDAGEILVHEGSNIQDNAICHEGVEIGSYSTVGHAAILHNCTIDDGSLIGVNAVVLDGSSVGEGAIVAAGSTVTEETEIPPRSLFAGTPAVQVKDGVDDALGEVAAGHYTQHATRYINEAETIR